MATAALLRQVEQIRKRLAAKRAGQSPVLTQIREDPARILTLGGIPNPDPWQTDCLRCSDRRLLMLSCRQAGKSLVAGALALREALLNSGATVLLLAPVQRQAVECLHDKVFRLWGGLGRPLAGETENATRLQLSNGSRIIALPGEEKNIRGFASVSLLVIDEAARVPDALYAGVRPMLAASRGKLLCLSSAWGRQGWFYEAWANGGADWRRVSVKAADVGRIDPDFLAEERRVLGERVYSREYENVFSSGDDAYFDYDSVQRALQATGGEPPLF
jgi:hypothetical protein